MARYPTRDGSAVIVAWRAITFVLNVRHSTAAAEAVALVGAEPRFGRPMGAHRAHERPALALLNARGGPDRPFAPGEPA